MTTATKKKSAGMGSSARGTGSKKAAEKSGRAAAEVKGLPAEEELAALAEGLAGEEIGVGKLTTVDRIFLARLLRFLSGILNSRFVRRAALEGYSMEEHGEGWRFFDAASGRHRTLEVAFEGDLAPETFLDPAKRMVLEKVDAFENLWIPRARTIIARFVPEEHVGRFEAAFFRDLKQQPLGPLVIDSVSVFLDRVEALETSAEPGAKEVAATLQKRGLTAKRIADVRNDIAALRYTTVPVTRRSDSALDADRLQAEGLRNARAWWNDWATTLRPKYDVREQIVLGLTDLRFEKLPPESAAPAEPASAGGSPAGGPA